jgi:hypothetical protein
MKENETLNILEDEILGLMERKPPNYEILVTQIKEIIKKTLEEKNE